MSVAIAEHHTKARVLNISSSVYTVSNKQYTITIVNTLTEVHIPAVKLHIPALLEKFTTPLTTVLFVWLMLVSNNISCIAA